MPYHQNIVNLTNNNNLFRQVLFTGERSQLVVMCIPPGGEIGAEVHHHVEQVLVFVNGTGESIMDGVKQPVAGGDVVIVPPGIKHNFVNTGKVPLKLYTVYAPPNHIDGRVHRTKAEADADTEDEAFGESRT